MLLKKVAYKTAFSSNSACLYVGKHMVANVLLSQIDSSIMVLFDLLCNYLHHHNPSAQSIQHYEAGEHHVSL